MEATYCWRQWKWDETDEWGLTHKNLYIDYSNDQPSSNKTTELKINEQKLCDLTEFVSSLSIDMILPREN